jgi:hypothetical protein
MPEEPEAHLGTPHRRGAWTSMPWRHAARVVAVLSSCALLLSSAWDRLPTNGGATEVCEPPCRSKVQVQEAQPPPMAPPSLLVWSSPDTSVAFDPIAFEWGVGSTGGGVELIERVPDGPPVVSSFPAVRAPAGVINLGFLVSVAPRYIEVRFVRQEHPDAVSVADVYYCHEENSGCSTDRTDESVIYVVPSHVDDSAEQVGVIVFASWYVPSTVGVHIAEYSASWAVRLQEESASRETAG